MNTREIVMANVNTGSISISSLIVAAFPDHAQPVREGLQTLPGVEVHAESADGRMVVSIEAPTDDDTVARFEQIRQMPGVMSASMVYHQFEPEPDEEA